jgi:nucleotide-binding universal stress UspA family protein
MASPAPPPVSYKKILVALDATDADVAVLSHVVTLARMFGSSVVLLHVADGWAARLFGSDAVSPEIQKDRAYLKAIQARLAGEGINAEAELAYGEPSDQIVRWIDKCGCDLLAMSTHGHQLFTNMLFGMTVDKVRRSATVPVLLVRSG